MAVKSKGVDQTEFSHDSEACAISEGEIFILMLDKDFPGGLPSFFINVDYLHQRALEDPSAEFYSFIMPKASTHQCQGFIKHVIASK